MPGKAKKITGASTDPLQQQLTIVISNTSTYIRMIISLLMQYTR